MRIRPSKQRRRMPLVLQQERIDRDTDKKRKKSGADISAQRERAGAIPQPAYNTVRCGRLGWPRMNRVVSHACQRLRQTSSPISGASQPAPAAGDTLVKTRAAAARSVSRRGGLACVGPSLAKRSQSRLNSMLRLASPALAQARPASSMVYARLSFHDENPKLAAMTVFCPFAC